MDILPPVVTSLNFAVIYLDAEVAIFLATGEQTIPSPVTEKIRTLFDIGAYLFGRAAYAMFAILVAGSIQSSFGVSDTTFTFTLIFLAILIIEIVVGAHFGLLGIPGIW